MIFLLLILSLVYNKHNCYFYIPFTTLCGGFLYSHYFIAHPPSLDSMLDSFLIRILLTRSGLDLKEDDLIELTRGETVEDDIVDSLAYEDHISHRIGKVGEEWCQLLMHMTRDD